MESGRTCSYCTTDYPCTREHPCPRLLFPMHQRTSVQPLIVHQRASLRLFRDGIPILCFKLGSIPTPGQTTPEITCTRFYCKLCPGVMLHTTKVISVTGNDRQYLHTRLPNITSEATFHPEMYQGAQWSWNTGSDISKPPN